MKQQVDLARRNLLRGNPAAPPPIRPPGAIAEARFTQACTACHECVSACPEHIVVAGDAGFPEIDFGKGECTFCNRCIDACPEGVLQSDLEPPWRLRITVGDTCLAKRQVVCQTCGDFCDARAIRFRPAIGRVPVPEILDANCTGCGACISACPETAIEAVPYG